MRQVAEVVKKHIDHFDREVLIEIDHPLYIKQMQKEADAEKARASAKASVTDKSKVEKKP
jgi:NAD(P)H-dependent FMN reductase